MNNTQNVEGRTQRIVSSVREMSPSQQPLYQIVNEQMRNTEQEFTNLKHQNEYLQKNLDSVRSELRNLKDQNDYLLAQYDVWKTKYLHIKEQNKSLQEEISFWQNKYDEVSFKFKRIILIACGCKFD